MRKLPILCVLGLAASLLAALPAASAAADPASAVLITPGGGQLDCSPTLANGHVAFEKTRVHVFTDGATDTEPGTTTNTDLVRCTFPVAIELADVGAPTLDWTFAKNAPQTGALTAAGMTLVLSDGSVLVGEYQYGGAGDGNPDGDWWMWDGSPQVALGLAPSCIAHPSGLTSDQLIALGYCTGGSGNAWHGTLAQWAQRLTLGFGHATVVSAGWEVGIRTGQFGNGYVEGETVGAHEFTFSSTEPTPPPTVVTPTPVDTTTVGCRTANVSVSVQALGPNEVAEPATVKYRVGLDGAVVSSGRLAPGQSFATTRTLTKRTKSSLLRVYFGGMLEKTYTIRRNCDPA